MVVWVDADACPRSVLQYLRAAEARYGYLLRTIASQNHCLDLPGHITVDPEPQATDMAIINRVQSGDLVVTQDWGLAAVVLAKGARALSPGGEIYRMDRMDFMLEQRNQLARFRRSGGRTKGPAARTKGDDQRFQAALHQLMS